MPSSALARLLGGRPRGPQPASSVRTLLTRTWTGRIFLGALVLQLVLSALPSLTGAAGVLDAPGTLVRLALVVTGLLLLGRLLGLAKRHLLWRVRRRLILSYLLIGVVPVLLVLAFTTLGGLLLFFQMSAYLLKAGIDETVTTVSRVARRTAREVSRDAAVLTAPGVLQRAYDAYRDDYGGLSVAIVPWPADGASANGTPVAGTVGAWTHAPPPASIPPWMSVGGFAGLLVVTSPSGETQLVVRGVGVDDERNPTFGVVVDVPLDEQMFELLHERTGVEPVPGAVRLVGAPTPGEPVTSPAPTAIETRGAGRGAKWFVPWVTFLEQVDWSTGRSGPVTVSVLVSVRDVYERILGRETPIARDTTFGDMALLMLAVIAALFLVIEFVALVMGFTLARSITGSVHALFMGTERVRQGDFAHRISVPTNDQLGELATSFNQMTASVEDLLQQAAEKKRLEEELRIARQIQMSLLPEGPLRMRGLAVTALCVPAREVGGDYYDFFPLGESRLGVLIADVAGKGTSAALYMAELKGLMLSLSGIYQSPKRLLIEVNRIISAHLDNRSFITMTYAVVDLDAGTLTYARAGHTPLIHCTAARGEPEARVLTPSGLVLGLRIDGISEKFEALLEECEVRLHPGDVVVLFTDGFTEAMNPQADLFGEERFKTLIEQHGHLPSEQLRERILREIESFVGSAEQHDDMTMILLKIEALAGVRTGSSPHETVA